MKPTHKVFFAIPFDSASKNMYERVARRLRKRFPWITTIIGTQEVSPSPKYSNMASFRAQNRELNRQFVTQIRSADVIVADLTHNNPNVHVELGIALTENRNILRVTGRSVTELGFDIRNLDVRQYQDEGQLTKTLVQYLRTFFSIKRLTISPRHAALYFREPAPLRLEAIQRDFDMQSTSPPSYLLRDGGVRATFEILKAKSPDCWFGIYIRTGESPFLGSHLIYVRQNGAVELAVYPGPVVVETFSLDRQISGIRTLALAFENDYLEIAIGRVRLKSSKLSLQTAGRIAFAAWGADVIVQTAEVIRRDTIDWN
jgi:hypothetical protein